MIVTPGAASQFYISLLALVLTVAAYWLHAGGEAPVDRAVLVLAFPAFARAAVVQSAADGLLIERTYHITATPAAAWRCWCIPNTGGRASTQSGSTANLSPCRKPAVACERWSDGGTKYTRVIHVRTNQLLRTRPLGPMQEMASRRADHRLSPANGTEAKVTYR